MQIVSRDLSSLGFSYVGCNASVKSTTSLHVRYFEISILRSIELSSYLDVLSNDVSSNCTFSYRDELINDAIVYACGIQFDILQYIHNN